ncbi:PAS domain-containing protein [Candidatus Saccharibacteria bacterium]|nr:PAS domain-containing protein [Candidatus Saccharibacteria bacterium]
MKPVDAGTMAQLALRSIHDGVIIVDREANVKFINPAAAEMTGVGSAENAFGLQLPLVMKFQAQDGSRVNTDDDKVVKAVRENRQFETKEYVLLGQGDRTTPVAVIVMPSGDSRTDRVITFRDITKELEEEGAQTEFISTASHEMRTPVASIEGYLGLALNPQTATIDARARQYLESAHAASQRLGGLFKDLLDVTRLEDKRIRANLVPIELTEFVRKFAEEYKPKFKEKNISYSFGTEAQASRIAGGIKTINQVVYTFVDVNFLGEILSNLIENAIKYTPNGGAVWVNVQGDGDRALIVVTDTGIGIAAEDLQHIFQKFYRADNSQTRTVGGTGLGLYLVKQRTEAMEGRVWAESAFGEGSTFYVSLPRLTSAEFEKRQIAAKNRQAVQAFAETALNQRAAENAAMLRNNLPIVEKTFNPELLAQAPQPQAVPGDTGASMPQSPAPTAPQFPAQEIPGSAPASAPVQAPVQAPVPTPTPVSVSVPAPVPTPTPAAVPVFPPQATMQPQVEVQQPQPQSQPIQPQPTQPQVYVQPEIGAENVQPIQSAMQNPIRGV